MAEIVLEEVSHQYPGAASPTLRSVNLQIDAGARHALLGSSGAGKTTLLNLLSGLDAPTSGRILFNGHEVNGLGARERNVAQVFQFPVLYESLNVARNLEFPLKNRGFGARQRRRRARDIAERLGIEALMGRRPQGLSLFEKQLVAIGRALVRPDVALVLLDEPLTAVEPSTKWQLRKVLKSAQEELGATMIYVTHDQTEALTFADRISVLHEGVVLQTDSAEALFDEPSHEHVASFIGSPGMNLLPGEIRAGAVFVGEHEIGYIGSAAPGPCTVGFRPEWGKVVEGAQASGGVPADVLGVRTLGVRARAPVGIVTARLQGHQINLRQTLDVQPGAHVVLQVDNVLAFRDGGRIAAQA